MKRTLVWLSIWSVGRLVAQTTDTPKLLAEQRQVTALRTTIGPAFGTAGIQATTIVMGPIMAGAPYSAEAVTERIQTLSDGNRIVQKTTSSIARDSQGRIRRDESLGIALRGSAGTAPKITMIEDPVAHFNWRLDPQMKTAFKTGFSSVELASRGATFSTNALPVPGPERTFFYSSGAPGSQVTVTTTTKRTAENETNPSHSDLGSQTIEGVVAEGTRVSRTVPAGTVGNEQPFTIVSESWYSPDLHVIVMSRSEDPRIGVTTYRLTNIQRGEPSPSLFEVPADYAVKDQPGDVLFFRGAKKVP